MPRLYGENEVSELLRRASEIQASDAGGTTSGLSLDELKSIAREVGIDPKYVEEAALSRGTVRKRDERFHFWGGPVTITEDRIVEGEVTEDVWPELLAALRDGFGDAGESSQIGRVLEWRHAQQGHTYASASIAPRRGRTTVRVQRSLAVEATLIHLIPLLMAFMFAVLFTSVGVGLPVLTRLLVSAAVLGVTFAGARWGVGAIARSQQRKVDTVMDRIETIVTDAVGAAPERTPARAPSEPSRLALPEPDPAPPAADAVPDDRRRTQA